MSNLTVTVRYEKNTGLMVSPFELANIYLYGVKIQDRSGQTFTKDAWEFYIRAAQQEVENYLNIKLQKQVISETRDFYQDEYRQWSFINVTYPVVKALLLEGFLGSVKQITYPKEWISSKKTNDGFSFFRRLYVVPAQSTDPLQVGGSSILYSGVLPYTNLMGYHTIPNYWKCTYCTGFDKLPYDILDVIGKIAAISLMNVAGDIALGQAALASYSLSIDGLSQSVGTTNSATSAAFGARIKQYAQDLKTTLDRIKGRYKGVVVSSM